MKTLFEKIIDGELPADKVYEDEKVIAIRDKYPKAPIHLLIITRRVIPDIDSLAEGDFPLIGHIFRVAQKLAHEQGLDDGGYRILVNNGPYSGQEIPHLHFHLLGGHPLGPMG